MNDIGNDLEYMSDWVFQYNKWINPQSFSSLMGILETCERLGPEFRQLLENKGFVKSLDRSAGPIDKYLSVDGANISNYSITSMFAMHRALACGVLNSKYWGDPVPSYIIYPPESKQTIIVDRIYNHHRVPATFRDIFETQLMSYMLEKFKPSLAFVDGSVISIINYTQRKEEQEIGIKNEYFQQLVDNLVTPEMDKLISLSEQYPVVYMPKFSPSSALIKRYFNPQFSLAVERNPFLSSLTDIVLLSKQLQQGEYILPEDNLTNLQTAGSTTRDFSYFLDNFKSVYFQPCDPEIFPIPLRFEIHKNHLDQLENVLATIQQEFDVSTFSIKPLYDVDIGARNEITSSEIMIDDLLIQALLNSAKTTQQRVYATIMFDVFRKNF